MYLLVSRFESLPLSLSFCLDTKRNKKIKAKGMLPPALLRRSPLDRFFTLFSPLLWPAPFAEADAFLIAFPWF